jgi:hypothetical protein
MHNNILFKCLYLQEFNNFCDINSEILKNQEYINFLNSLNENLAVKLKWNQIAIIMFLDDYFARIVNKY